jgi:membrane protein implicated in regulation of membrane protease activity
LGWAFGAGSVLAAFWWRSIRQRRSRPSTQAPLADRPGEIVARSRSKGGPAAVIVGGVLAYGVAWYFGLLVVAFFLPIHLVGARALWRKASEPSGFDLQAGEGPPEMGPPS